MKASEFIRVFGLDIARMAINECPPEYDLDTVELKRLVDSHELVEAEGGLLNVKNSFQMERDCGGVDMTPFGKKLYQAIADVESCL